MSPKQRRRVATFGIGGARASPAWTPSVTPPHITAVSNMKTIFRVLLATMALTLASSAGVITNGGFESGLAGWRPLWTREANAGSLSLDASTVRSGKYSARIEHRGEKDWSLEPALRLTVQPGEVFELEAWLKVESRGGSVTLCVSTHDAQGKALDWSYGERSLNDTADWQRVRTQFVVPPGVAEIQPRLIGYARLFVLGTDSSLEKPGQEKVTPPANPPATLSLTNASLEIALNTRNG